MKRGELAYKIIVTILSAIMIIGIIYLFIRFITAQYLEDAILYGLSLAAIGGGMFIIIYASSLITDLWKKKKDTDKKE